MFGWLFAPAILYMHMVAGAVSLLGRAGSHLFSARQSSQTPQELFRAGRARGMSLDELYRAGRDRGMSRTDMLRLAYSEGVPIGDVVSVALNDGMDPKELLALGKREGISEPQMIAALLGSGRSVREVFSLQSVPRQVTDTFERELRSAGSIATALKSTYAAHDAHPGDVANLATMLGAESSTLQKLGLGQYSAWYKRFAGIKHESRDSDVPSALMHERALADERDRLPQLSQAIRGGLLAYLTFAELLENIIVRDGGVSFPALQRCGEVIDAGTSAGVGGKKRMLVSGRTATTVRSAVATFHGNPLELAAALAGLRVKGFPCSSPGRPHEMQAHEATHGKVVAALTDAFRSLDPRERCALIEEAVDDWLDHERDADPTWKLLASSRGEALDAIMAPVFDSYFSSTFNNDPDADKITEGLRTIAANLPRAVRLHIMAAACAAGPFKNTEELLCALIKAAGTGAVKCGQHMSENQAIPERFRSAFAPLRDKNTALDPLEVARRVDPEVAVRIAAIGPRVGTGSAKQVNRVTDRDGRRLDLCVTLPDGLEAFRVIRDACKDVPLLENVLSRMTPVVEREFDLRLEQRAFAEVRASHLGRCDYVDVPKVTAAAKDALLREHVEGDTLAAILRTTKGKVSKKLAKTISRFHADLITAAWPSPKAGGDQLGLLMTDPHDANFTVVDEKRIGLFDVGQREFLTKEQGTLFLVLMSQFAVDKSDAEVSSQLSSALVGHCDHGTMAQQDAVLALKTAFADVSDRDLNAGRKMLAWFDCAADRGVYVPVAFVGAAKMLDTLANRELRLGLEPTVAPALAKLMQERLIAEPAAPPSTMAVPDIELAMPLKVSVNEARERLRERLAAKLAAYGISAEFRSSGDIHLEGSGLSRGVRGVVHLADKTLSVSIVLGPLKRFASMVRGQLGAQLAAALA